MTRFVFLTKTLWEEPPRIRHQLAHLLAGAGHSVLFFEKPSPPWKELPQPRTGAERITVARHHELIHHKLRLLSAVHRLNAMVVRRSLRQALSANAVDADAVIVNFNYDYWFLRELFPRQRLLTVINDDFVSTALLGFVEPLRWALGRTCRGSDRVLTVSPPLQRELAEFCRAELFLPWADRPYVDPSEGVERDVLLFWGFINSKVDFDVLQRLADDLLAHRPELKLMLVGPVEQDMGTRLDALRTRSNVTILPAASLDTLPLSKVLAALIPCRRGVPEIDAITLPNKALQLLARGLPLLISGMPHFIREPFVFRLDDDTSTLTLLDQIKARFTQFQPDIKSYVANNAAPARLAQFLQLALPI